MGFCFTFVDYCVLRYFSPDGDHRAGATGDEAVLELLREVQGERDKTGARGAEAKYADRDTPSGRRDVPGSAAADGGQDIAAKAEPRERDDENGGRDTGEPASDMTAPKNGGPAPAAEVKKTAPDEGGCNGAARPADAASCAAGEAVGADPATTASAPRRTREKEGEMTPPAEADSKTGGEAGGKKTVFRAPNTAADSAPAASGSGGAADTDEAAGADKNDGGATPCADGPHHTDGSERRGMSSWIGGFAAALVCAFLLAGPISWSFFAGDLYYVKDDEGELAGCVLTHRDARAAYSEVIEIADEDEVVSETVGSTEFLSVVRAFSVTVQADGAQTEVRFASGTVEDALAAAEVELGEDDLVSPSLDTELADGDVVTVRRVTYRTREESEEVMGEQVIKRSPLIRDGTTQVMNEESLGEVLRVYRDRYVDGVLADSEIVSEQTVKAPTNSIVLEGDSSAVMSPLDGSRFTSASIVGGVPSSYTNVISGRSTAYSSSRTLVYGASGLYLSQGFVAVNPDVIPYGSLLYITSSDGSFVYGWAIAADTGLALMDGSAVVDCFFDTYRESCLFGAHTLDVYVVEQLTQSQLEGYMGNEGLFRSRIPE